ncbi:MAG: hyaluronoglucosaminidase, partial [Actinomycetota bacterium]|nr:hyaluronoglucosaminidase [Actinomycetota bacterium]
MDRSVRAADSVVPVLRSFAVRGVVEGFYGTPWTHDARLEVISFLAARGMNAYAYAPKDDARHRAEWREPYDSAELEQFGELAGHAVAHGVQFGFAISPGLDIHYESASDRQTLLRKLAPLRDAGVSWFLLLLDDIPMQPGLAPRQAALVTWLHSALDGASLTMCPTEYVGTRPSPYLAELGSGMPAAVDVMWTGPTVCSPSLSADDARGWTRALGDRRVIVWDNYPVNDALMTASLHLGP